MPLGQNSKCGRNRALNYLQKKNWLISKNPLKPITFTALYPRKLCRGSVTFWCWSVTYWYGSRSSDPYLWLTDPDPGALITYGSCESWSWCGAGSGTRVHSHNSSQFLDTGRIRSRIRRTCGLRMRIREAKKHTDPMDAYPVTLLKEWVDWLAKTRLG
jgi:hypothetical protein